MPYWYCNTCMSYIVRFVFTMVLFYSMLHAWMPIFIRALNGRTAAKFSHFPIIMCACSVRQSPDDARNRPDFPVLKYCIRLRIYAPPRARWLILESTDFYLRYVLLTPCNYLWYSPIVKKDWELSSPPPPLFVPSFISRIFLLQLFHTIPSGI